MDMLSWIVLIYVFTSAFGAEGQCPQGMYFEQRKGCKGCAEICVNNPFTKEDCDYYCDGWSPEPAASSQDVHVPAEDVPEGRPGDDTRDASSMYWVAAPIVCIFVLVSIVVGAVIYKIKHKQGPRSRNICPNNALPLIDMSPEIPEVIVHPDAEQAVIAPEGVPNPEDEENSDDAGARAAEGPGVSDGETSDTGSRLSLYPFTEEASQDENRDETNLCGSTFCSGESNAGLAQLIMKRMPNTALCNFVTPDADERSITDLKHASSHADGWNPTSDVDLPPEEFKGTGKGARPKEPKAPTQVKDSRDVPKLSRVPLGKRARGRHRSQLFVQSTSQPQESPDQMLSDTTAVGQPMSRDDPTAKYYLGEQVSAQPYLTQCLNAMQPAAQGQVPDGVNTYRHDDVNARYGPCIRH